MDEEGVCRGVLALDLADRHAAPASAPRAWCWPPAATVARTSPRPRRTPAPATAAAMALRAGLAAAGHGVRAVPPDRHLRRRLPHHRRRARRGRHTSRNSKGERFMERYAPNAKDLASRDVVSRSMTLEIREGRGVGEHEATTSTSTSSHLGRRTTSTRSCRASPRARARSSPNVDVTKEPIPVMPTVHYNMGGIPTNYHGEVVQLKDGNPDAVVPGLYAIGEAACVSVHGANRLGSNSLLDLVVFGRAAANRCAETIRPGMPHKSAAVGRRRQVAVAQLRQAAPRQRPGPPPPTCACEMQRTMQEDAAVFRTARTAWREGVGRIRKTALSPSRTSASADRSLIWNSDLIETLELRQPAGPGARHHDRLGARTARSRAAPRPARTSGRSDEQGNLADERHPRRRTLARAHAVLGGRGGQHVASTTAPCT